MDASTYQQRLEHLLAPLKREKPLASMVANLDDQTDKINCLLMLVILDIFRGLRKYMFVSSKKIRKELAHLLNKDEFPAHYPKYLIPKTLPKFASLNPVFLTVEEIQTINNEIQSLHKNLTAMVKPSEKNSQVNFTPRVMVSEKFFSQLANIKELRFLEAIMASVFTWSYALQPPDRQLYSLRPEELRSLQAQGSYFVKDGLGYCLNACVNFTYALIFVARQSSGAKKDLLIEGELHGQLTVCEYYSSITINEPKRETPFVALMLSSMHKIMVNYLNNKTIFDMKNTPYVYHLGKSKKERFLIKDRLDPDYIVAAGNYRLDRVVRSPIQFVDKISMEANAQNYVRSMVAPKSTQQFLEEFDGHQLLKILESIPGFVYKFSEQQRELIASKENAVVVGRSGTGKTTCAVMRMIGIRLLEIANRNAKKGIKKIRYQDLCESNIGVTRIEPQDGIHYGQSTASSHGR